MKCFYHPEKEAVGICKNCNRGLCNECLKEYDNGLACKGRCEDQVESINNLINKNIKINKNLNKSYMVTITFYIGVGSLFIIWGILRGNVGNLIYFLVPIGLLFLFLGVVSIFNVRKLKK